MARMLVIDSRETVVNLVVVPDMTENGGSAWSPPAGTRIEPAPEGVGIGWSKNGSEWLPPEPPPAEDI